MLPSLLLIPLLAAPTAYICAKKSAQTMWLFVRCVTGIIFAIGVCMLVKVLGGCAFSLELPGICGMGMHFTMDGFRAIYCAIAGLMWFGVSLFSPEYFPPHKLGRFAFFLLLTQCGMLGMFLAADYYTMFIFFELMSMCSYPWVAHEENEESMRAAETYLAIAVIGGMATLMGIFMLYSHLGVLGLDAVREQAASLPVKDRRLIGALIAVGFAGKAGVFPLHIWLPKAHPAAPAPASALLSGILTKGGIWGLMTVTCTLLPGDAVWGNALFMFALTTMTVGAVLALFSMNLKRTLACSSMSQIGFILTGVSMGCLLGEEGTIAFSGAVMHMCNHSLIKLCLFLCAGAVYMQAHTLDLNRLRGFGKGKPVLMIAFALGAMGIMGIPLGNGFASKSLLHEGILEYSHIAPEGLYGWYKAAEWLFLLSGGMTAAYMTKLFVILFIEGDKPSESRPFRPATNVILIASGLICLTLGILPDTFLGGAARAAMSFFNVPAPGAISFFSWENLHGAIISLSFGAGLYFGLVRPYLLCERWPSWLDLEKLVYRPLIEHILPSLFGGICSMADKAANALFSVVIPAVGTVFARAADSLTSFTLDRILMPVIHFVTRLADDLADALALVLMRTLFREKLPDNTPIVGSRFTWRLGRLLNRLSRSKRRDYVAELAAGAEEAHSAVTRITRTVSFGLLLLCVCVVGVFAYLLLFR